MYRKVAITSKNSRSSLSVCCCSSPKHHRELSILGMVYYCRKVRKDLLSHEFLPQQIHFLIRKSESTRHKLPSEFPPLPLFSFHSLKISVKHKQNELLLCCTTAASETRILPQSILPQSTIRKSQCMLPQ